MIRYLTVFVVIFLSLWDSAQAENQLNDPGFESAYQTQSNCNQVTGVISQGWQDDTCWDINADITYARDSNNPHSGSSSQRIRTLGSLVQFVQNINLSEQTLYSASVWMRSQSPMDVTLMLRQSGSPYTTYAEQSITLSSEWQKINLSQTTPAENSFFMIRTEQTGTFWIDDAELDPAPNLIVNGGFESTYQTPSVCSRVTGNIAQGWSDNSCWNTPSVVAYAQETNNPHSGESAQKITVNNPLMQILQPVSLQSGFLYQSRLWMRSDANMDVTLLIRKSESPYTYYAQKKVSLTSNWKEYSVEGAAIPTDGLLMILAEQTGTFWIDDVQFYATQFDTSPPLPTDAVTNQYFGMHYHSESLPWFPTGLDIGTVRIWDAVQWAEINTSPGVYDWTALDLHVNRALQNGADIIFNLARTPHWASARPDEYTPYADIGNNQQNPDLQGQAAEPADIQVWRDWVTAVGRRYQGQIKYWEIWNEPNYSWFWTGTTEKLVELSQEAYTILKNIDSNNQIITPSPFDVGYLDEFLQLGGGDYADIIGYHFYLGDQTPEYLYESYVPVVKYIIKKNNQGNKVLWDTENGWPAISSISNDTAIGLVTRAYLLEWAAGVERFYFYAWDQQIPVILANPPGFTVLNSVGVAYAQMTGWLLGSRMVDINKESNGTWVIQLIQADGNQAYIIWNPEQAFSFSLPQSWNVVTLHDLSGNTSNISGISQTMINQHPILLRENGQVLPSAATLINPSGNSTENSPTYTWNAVANSTWYYLWVNDSSGNKIKQWYTAAQAGCAGGSDICSVTHASTLANGSARWWVQTWNNSGYGPWSLAKSFTIEDLRIPSAATLISPSGSISDNTPIYSWNAVSNATWYYLWVNDSSGNKIKQWYTAAQAGCAGGSGTCSATHATTLANGSARWWVQTWNNSGYGPWSLANSFTIGGSGIPPATTLINPSGTISDNTPIYSWNAISNATWYYLWVNDSSGNKIKQWYTAAQANCANGESVCSATQSNSLAVGLGQWWIQTWNSSGYGPWSSVKSFTVTAASGIQVTVDWGSVIREIPTYAYGINSPANFIPAYSNNSIFMSNLEFITQKKGFIRLHGWGMLGDSPEAWQDNGVWDSSKIEQALRPLVDGAYTVMINIPSGPLGEDDYLDSVAFAKFCADLVKIVNIDHGLGIKYWEIPNEREAGFTDPGLSVSEMATLIKTTANAMKAVDPTIKVGGPATAWVNVDYLSQLVDEIYPNIDFITAHSYSGDGSNSLQNAYDVAQFATADLAELRARINLITGDSYLPIFLSEYNISHQGDPRIQTYEGAVYDAIILTESITAGADATMFWAMAPYSDMSLLDGDTHDENAHLFEIFNQSFHGNLVTSQSYDPTKVTIYAVSNQTGNGGQAFSLINRTATPQAINLTFNSWLPSDITWHLWDANNDFSTRNTSWVDLNQGNFILSPYSVNLFIGQSNRVATTELPQTLL